MLPWHECEEHRQDPEEHHTTRLMQKDVTKRQSQALLPSERPEPVDKRRKQERKPSEMMINRKRVVQSAHPHSFRFDKDLCPKLAAKFPRLYRVEGATQDHGMHEADSDSDPEHAIGSSSHMETPGRHVQQPDCVKLVQSSSTATGAACARAGGSSPVRMSEGGAASSSGSHYRGNR